MNMHWKRICFSLLSLLLLAALPASAQTVTAAVVGTITDPAGAAVPGATVTVTSVERGTSFSAVTNDVGLYRISQLPVGTYTLSVQKKGFATIERSAFVLVLNQVALVNVALKIGQASQTVQVTGVAPILQTQATHVGTIINAETNDELPLATRNYVELTLLAPGSVTYNPSSFVSGNNTSSGGRPLINGNREQSNNFILDGMDNNQVSDNLIGYTPPPDAIQEFDLITNNASAEFGNFMGGIVNATLKSGTNSFHGDVWEFFRNDVLNANSWANNLHLNSMGVLSPLAKSAVRWNMFGATGGGPILKNKLFFFADYQGQRFDIPTTQVAFSLFTTDERTGNFGALCTAGFDGNGVCLDRGSNGQVIHQLYNPCASFSAPCTPSSTPASTRQPFANNVIPTVMISPVAANLFTSSLYPAATSDALQNNGVYTQVQARDLDQGDFKIDYRPTSKDNLSYRFTKSYQNNPTTNSTPLIASSFSTAPIFSTVGNWTRTLTNNLLNNARVGYNHVTLNNGNTWLSSVGQAGNTLGIGNGNPVGLDGLLALNFSNSDVTNLGAAVNTEVFNDTVWQLEDGLTWIHGRHTLSVGGQYWLKTITTFYAGNNGELGLMNFDGRFTAINSESGGGGAGGDGGADFVLGLPYEYGRGVSTGATWQQSENLVGIYAEDTWRATDNLTFNLGVRYDAHSPWVETDNKQSNYNFSTGNVDIAGINGASRALYRGFYGGRDFQPRLGFAWTPAMLGGRTVIRGAFTISSYLEGTGTNLRLPLNPPFTPAEIQVVYNNLPLPLTDTSDGIVGQGTNPSCAPPAYACFSNALIRIWDPNVQPAISDQYNLTVQHQFPHAISAAIGYVGQKGTHLMVPFDYGQRVLEPDSSCGTPPCTAPSPYFVNNPTLYSVLGNPAQGGLGAKISGTNSNGNMMYNSMQAVLQQQLTRGLQGQIAYTYSKCMTNNAGYYGVGDLANTASVYWQNVYNQRSEWAPCDVDTTHLIAAYAVYDLPFGRGQRFAGNSNRAVDEVIGGWEVSPILSWHTGFPMKAPGAGDNSGTYSRGARSDCSSIPSITNTGIAGVGRRWFVNNGNFTQPLAGFGDCTPVLSALRGPHYTDLDASIHKNFQITQRFRVQFRTDFINAFNHPQYNAPNMSLGSTIGQITSTQNPRNIQLALKIYY